MAIRAISFDLDDTLWPIAPAIEQAEQAVHEWLDEHHPQVSDRYSTQDLRELRGDVADAHPERTHDLGFLRLETLRRAFRVAGVDTAQAEQAYAVFFAARNRVELFEDALAVLSSLSRQWALACISNGNADVETIGIGHYFRVCIHAVDVGTPKPHPLPFLAALEALSVAPQEVLHVGDSLAADVAGARRVGMRAVWFNRAGRGGTPPEGVPVIEALDQLPGVVAALDDAAGEASDGGTI